MSKGERENDMLLERCAKVREQNYLLVVVSWWKRGEADGCMRAAGLPCHSPSSHTSSSPFTLLLMLLQFSQTKCTHTYIYIFMLHIPKDILPICFIIQ